MNAVLNQRAMDGVLLIDKPDAISSAEVVRRIKARVKPARVGHLGTLDPFATGLLPILIGQGTKLAQFLEQGDKQYQGTIVLGAETDTLDRCGEIVRTATVPSLDRSALARIAARFTGRIEQVPPLFSAIKRGGVPLYKLARRGGPVEPAPARAVDIVRLELEAVDDSSLRFDVVCSPGTYIRSLARDIGVALGSAAHLAELQRLRSSGFSVESAFALDDALVRITNGDTSVVIGTREALASMAEVVVDEAVRNRLYNGDWAALDCVRTEDLSPFKVICDGDLVAIAEMGINHRASLLRVFSA
ncbi:MAG TPA: tRNA pseudouridine(55) synthase TruB [Candidatus Binataceae bacterium]|nr:tRNA pseudouridine(55) synthase TruB [Candidatus Binataceae bacterium]